GSAQNTVQRVSAQAPADSTPTRISVAECKSIVSNVVRPMMERCSSDPNTACYANLDLAPGFDPSISPVPVFKQPGDQIGITPLTSLVAGAFDSRSRHWGVGILNLKVLQGSHVPTGSIVKFVIYGDTQVNNSPLSTPIEGTDFTTLSQFRAFRLQNSGQGAE